LCCEREHAQRCADLLTFVRQHHAERDLQALAQLVVEEEAAWTL